MKSSSSLVSPSFAAGDIKVNQTSDKQSCLSFIMTFIWHIAHYFIIISLSAAEGIVGDIKMDSVICSV